MEGAPLRILIADDDPVCRRLLVAGVAGEGRELIAVADGEAALRTLQQDSPPPLALLDWEMPGRSGLDVCREVRAQRVTTVPYQILVPYLILITSRGRSEDIAAGFAAGADDYVVKPFDPDELRARVGAGVRIVRLQHELADRVTALEEALARVKTLHGMLPICAWCKKIRSDGDYWQQVDSYITAHTDAQFSHSICPDCHEKHVVPQLARLRQLRTT
jgi:sigma-B regulation protein RsbU (phosphoserine phosphatase)